MWHPKKNLDPFLPVFSHFFMSYFDVFGSIFEKSAMTDLPKVIVSICLVSYNICMIPHVWGLTFGLNLSGAWGDPHSCSRGSKLCLWVDVPCFFFSSFFWVEKKIVLFLFFVFSPVSSLHRESITFYVWLLHPWKHFKRITPALIS